MKENDEWISVDTPPERSMKVRVKYENGAIDIAFYKEGDYLMFDIDYNLPITHWKPL